MKERTWNYDFKHTGDMLACKNAIVGFFIVSYKHSRSLDHKLNKLAKEFDSSKKGK